jgi:UDP-N-acetylmuramate--alanine ligase
MAEHKKDMKLMYFVGIGGIGMSALALFYHKNGMQIKGYDKTPSAITDKLINEGIDIAFVDEIAHIPDDVDIFIYTPAIPENLQIFIHAKESKKPILKRSEALGLVSKKLNTIAVAGTHGKTTITSILAHIYKYAGKEILSFIGGITKNYNSNVLMSDNPEILIVEADEFDRSFLTLYPDKAIISAIDADHLDIYGTKEDVQQAFISFSNQIKPDGTLLISDQIENIFSTIDVKTYGFNKESDFYIKDFRIENASYIFSINTYNKKIADIHFQVAGRHNVLNAVAAAAMAIEDEIDLHTIKNALESYQGVKRRFETIYQGKKTIYIDDYAHHPEELKNTINSLKELYPNKRITGVFQPHLYSRTKDFADDFALSLALLDEIILLEIYPAREEPIEGVTSEWLLEKVDSQNKYLVPKEKLVDFLKERNDELIISLGAGDIDTLVEPIAKLLKENE